MAGFSIRKWRRLSRSLGPAVIAVAAFALGSSLNKRAPEPPAAPVIPVRAAAAPTLGLPTVANLALPAPPAQWSKEQKRTWWVAKNQETKRQRQALAAQLQIQRAAAADAAWRSSRLVPAPAFPTTPAPRRNAFAMTPEMRRILNERQQSAPVQSPGAAYAAQARPAYAQPEQAFPHQPLVTSSPQTFQSEIPREPQAEVSEIPTYPTDDPYRQFYRQKPSVSEQLRANGRIDGKPLAADRNSNWAGLDSGYGSGLSGYVGSSGRYYPSYSDLENGFGSGGYSGFGSSSKSKRGWDGVPKTVHVRSYTRKDGTYVRSHTRRPPRR